MDNFLFLTAVGADPSDHWPPKEPGHFKFMQQPSKASPQAAGSAPEPPDAVLGSQPASNAPHSHR